MFELVIEVLKQMHGEAIIYKGDGSLNSAFTGVFDEQYVGLDPSTGQRISDNTPSVLFAVADLPELPMPRSKFEIRGKAYSLSRIEPDGKGAARAFLVEEDI